MAGCSCPDQPNVESEIMLPSENVLKAAVL